MNKLSLSDKRELLEKEIKYELDFFRHIAKNDEFEVLTLPYDLTNDHIYTDEEIAEISLDCKKRDIKLIYRISLNSSIAIVYTEDLDLIGMVPELDTNGFIVN